MATKVVMEALSPTMEEGRLVEWKKNEGDTVAAGDVLAEVETDKAVMELVARAAGTLLKQVIPIGTTLPVGGIVAWLGAKGEAVPDGAGGQGPAASAPKPAAAAPAPAPAAVAGFAPGAGPAVTPGLDSGAGFPGGAVAPAARA